MKKNVADQIDDLRNQFATDINQSINELEAEKAIKPPPPIKTAPFIILLIAYLITSLIVSSVCYLLYNLIRTDVTMLPSISYFNFYFIFLLYKFIFKFRLSSLEN